MWDVDLLYRPLGYVLNCGVLDLAFGNPERLPRVAAGLKEERLRGLLQAYQFLRRYHLLRPWHLDPPRISRVWDQQAARSPRSKGGVLRSAPPVDRLP